jgi:glutamyl-tRNA reductase
MVENFVLIHHLGPSERSAENRGRLWIQWETCLRTISLGFVDPSEDVTVVNQGSLVFRSSMAYEFLLQVVCGLHSPIIGETEVMGQFKELVRSSKKAGGFNRIFNGILTDAKFVRQNLLRDVGSRSYGSLLRKYVKGAEHVTVLGAGKLSKEILPWLHSAPKLNVICRDVKKAKSLQARADVEINDMSQNNFGNILIIAAKINTPEVREFLRTRNQISQIIDLRENSTREPIALKVPTWTLKQLFGEIKTCETEVQIKVERAKSTIAELSQRLFCSAELRPFGWEDLCG